MLDPLKAHIKFVLHRNNCSITHHKRCVKDLNTIQNHSKTGSLILDYKPQNVAFSLDQSIIIMHWNGAEDDKELLGGMAPYLEQLAKCSDPVTVHREKTNYPEFLAKIYKPS